MRCGLPGYEGGETPSGGLECVSGVDAGGPARDFSFAAPLLQVTPEQINSAVSEVLEENKERLLAER